MYASKVKDAPSLDTRNWKDPKISIGQEMELDWIEMDEVHSPKDDLRFRGFDQGAACFARGEGCGIQKGLFILLVPTEAKQYGQIWQISGGKLILFSEPNDSDLVDNCDNITVAPWGDLILCEDGGGKQYLDVITTKVEFLNWPRMPKVRVNLLELPFRLMAPPSLLICNTTV